MRRQFANRKEGQQMAARSWVCCGCYQAHPRKVAACTCGVRLFHQLDSRRELIRLGELLWLRKAGTISRLEVHPRYSLDVRDSTGLFVTIGHYEADFSYFEDGARVCEDVKPSDPRAHDPLFVWKRKHFEAQYGMVLRLV